jgi:hypothetical protein
VSNSLVTRPIFLRLPTCPSNDNVVTVVDEGIDRSSDGSGCGRLCASSRGWRIDLARLAGLIGSATCAEAAFLSATPIASMRSERSMPRSSTAVSKLRWLVFGAHAERLVTILPSIDRQGRATMVKRALCHYCRKAPGAVHAGAARTISLSQDWCGRRPVPNADVTRSGLAGALPTVGLRTGFVEAYANLERAQVRQ